MLWRRPWYTNAQAKFASEGRKRSWSPVYVFKSGTLGITATHLESGSDNSTTYVLGGTARPPPAL